MDLEIDSTMKTNDVEINEIAPPGDENNNKNLIRLIKSIVINSERGKTIDGNVVQFRYYNSFNYSLLSRGPDHVNLTLGVTSPNPGEGKTLVAANLAVSLAMGSQKKTILVDLNFLNSNLHNIFGVPRSPGLAEAFTNGKIYVSESSVENLSVLTSGNFLGLPDKRNDSMSSLPYPFLSLDQLPAFRDVIYSLEQDYDFVIVDMPSMKTEEVPSLFVNQLSGLLVVINSGITKREEIDAMIHKINEHKILGFVFNKFKEEFS